MRSSKMIPLLLLLPLTSCTPPKKSKGPGPSSGDQTVGTGTTPTDGTTGSNPTEPEGTVVIYPTADAELGEVIHAGEVDAANRIAQVIEGQINTKFPLHPDKRALRDAHPKAHGCLKASFEVNPDIKTEFAHGVFTKGSKFDAVIRYSNSSHIPDQADIEKDGRGMAIKLFNVPGKKLLDVESQAKTQDFILISHPVFFTKDPTTYVDFISNFEDISSSNPFTAAKALAKTTAAIGIKGMAIANDIKKLQIGIPTRAKYFSNVPYQLGVGSDRKAVKYLVKPCGMGMDDNIVDNAAYINGDWKVPSNTDDPNYLRTRLVEHFKKSDACLDMFVQVRENPSMSVEDSMIEWTTEWHKIASLKMKKEDQDLVNSPDLNIPQNKACDTMSFNPWHSLPEHKPLGSMNRVRKIVYEHISKLRHSVNKEPRKEPNTY